jgi:hypothetical protein
MKRLIFSILVSITAFCGIMAWATGPSHASSCQPPQEIKDSIAEKMPTAEITDLGKMGTMIFLEVFNAAPPQSHHVASQIVIAKKPGAPRVGIFYFMGGCYTGSSFPTRQFYDSTMGKDL